MLDDKKMDYTEALQLLAELVRDNGTGKHDNAIRLIAQNTIRLEAKAAILTSQLNRRREQLKSFAS